jgi:hypothetical protein
MPFSFFKKQGAKQPKPLPKLEYKGGTKFGVNETNDMYLDVEELGGFPFIKTVIIGDFAVNVKRYGCTLDFNLKKGALSLESDNTTISSTQVKNSGIFVTEVDFQINEEDVAKLTKKNIREMRYTFKKNACVFKPL